KAGNKSSVQARYTFVYEKRDGKWLIINHHSSAMPEVDPPKVAKVK
ncbi:nuclear transport factor 2 family protein, partial [Xanthomonas citri]